MFDLASQLSAVKALYMAGAKLLAGTDVAPSNANVQGLSLHRELELLVKAGLSPVEALKAASGNTAEAFHLDRGRIVPGYRADLIMVRGDPTTDILAARDIVHVGRSGVEFNRHLPKN